MGRFAGSRSLIAIGVVLVVLLAALAVVQYRWSTRVASADAQREREHLDSAASLFASEFNGMVGQALTFLENNARTALDSGEPLTGVPKIVAEVYFIDTPAGGKRRAKRLGADGLFSPAPVPEWISPRCCPGMLIEEPLALVAPLFEMDTRERRGISGVRVQGRFRFLRERLFVGRIDQAYLRDQAFPQLIRRSFGETAAAEYDFDVAPLDRPRDTIYGTPLRADLRKPFFSMAEPLPIVRHSPEPDGPPRNVVVYRRIEGGTRGDKRLAGLFDVGIWELNVAHKGMPLAEAFERTRRLDLLMSLGVEALLVAAIILLVVGARRVERLADQKMRFVAGVSHELRIPVSAISMLSRNQADGLVSGIEKVRQYGELIHQQSRRLNEMVEQTLQYAGIHSGLRRPAKDQIDLRCVIQDALDARREELDRAGFQVEVALASGLPPLGGDAGLLRTALDNLLSNALRHAGSGRWIRVAAGYSAEEKEVRISVEDHGAGIEAAEQTDIFEPFTRGRVAIEAQIPGSGLGLSLVRSAAEAHRGSVTLVSGPGRGSTFTLHLPV
jgi:signal transduction histidine kinase